MTHLSPDRLEELAADREKRDAQVEEQIGKGMAADWPIGWAALRQENAYTNAALRAGAAAWRIATAFAKQAGHLDRCRALALPVGPCTCGLAALEQRLAALGGEGEQ